MEIPKTIREAPRLDGGLTHYWEAFLDLGTCRRYHFGGEGPIPWTAIHQWADWWGFDDVDDRAMFCRIMRRVDNWYLERQAEEAKKNGK